MAIIQATPLKCNLGLIGQSSTSLITVLPGGTAYSIPSGTLAAGDRVDIRFNLVRRGAQHTQNINHNLLIGASSVWGGSLAITATADHVYVVGSIHVVTSTSQSVFASSNPNTGSQNFGAITLAVNVATTALTIDFQGGLAAAATDTYGLESYVVQLVKAA